MYLEVKSWRKKKIMQKILTLKAILARGCFDKQRHHAKGSNGHLAERKNAGIRDAAAENSSGIYLCDIWETLDLGSFLQPSKMFKLNLTVRKKRKNSKVTKWFPKSKNKK